MANTFTVTTANQALKADANGSATASFTVTNSTARPIRGFVKTRALGNTREEWLKTDGEVERDFPAGGTHQFTVIFTKPKPATPLAASQPAESFPFRLDAISSTDPNMDFTEGPVVTVDFPEQKVEPKKAFPWWIVAVIAAVVLIIGGIVAWLLLRGDDDNGDNTNNNVNAIGTPTTTATPTPTTPTPVPVNVPNYTNSRFVDAVRELGNKGFKTVAVEEIAPGREIDRVFRQEPVGLVETSLADTTVKLFVPAATRVPQLQGVSFDEAVNRLKAAGLKIGTVKGSIYGFQTGDLREVQSQNQSVNASIAKGSAVNLIFACGPSYPIPGFPPFVNIEHLKRCETVSSTNSGSAPVNPNIKRQIDEMK